MDIASLHHRIRAEGRAGQQDPSWEKGEAGKDKNCGFKYPWWEFFTVIFHWGWLLSEFWLLPPLPWEIFCSVPLVSGLWPDGFFVFSRWLGSVSVQPWSDSAICNRESTVSLPAFLTYPCPERRGWGRCFFCFFSWLLSSWLRKPEVHSSQGTGHFHHYFYACCVCFFFLLCTLQMDQHVKKGGEQRRKAMCKRFLIYESGGLVTSSSGMTLISCMTETPVRVAHYAEPPDERAARERSEKMWGGQWQRQTSLLIFACISTRLTKGDWLRPIFEFLVCKSCWEYQWSPTQFLPFAKAAAESKKYEKQNQFPSPQQKDLQYEFKDLSWEGFRPTHDLGPFTGCRAGCAMGPRARRPGRPRAFMGCSWATVWHRGHCLHLHFFSDTMIFSIMSRGCDLCLAKKSEQMVDVIMKPIDNVTKKLACSCSKPRSPFPGVPCFGCHTGQRPLQEWGWAWEFVCESKSGKDHNVPIWGDKSEKEHARYPWNNTISHQVRKDCGFMLEIPKNFTGCTFHDFPAQKLPSNQQHLLAVSQTLACPLLLLDSHLYSHHPLPLYG